MIRFEAFEKLGVAVAAMSDKFDGDCGLGDGAQGAAVLRARANVCRQCGVDPGHLVTASQVHGTRVVQAGESDRGKGATAMRTALDSTDGIVTTVPGLPIAVFVADCVPVYLYDSQRGAVGLIHTGRRGTIQNIVGHAVGLLARDLNVRPADIHALIGPSAGPCCYEVSPEQVEAFASAGLPTYGRHLDLWEANAGQLTAAGVPRSQIAFAQICTICDGRFHSYRADSNASRNMALLVI